MININKKDVSTKKEFFYDACVYISDLNAFRVAYFGKYFDWQEKAQEELFRQQVPNYKEIANSGIKLLTLTASMHYIKKTRVFDELKIQVKIKNLRKVSMQLMFYFYDKHTNELVAEGERRVAFENMQEKIIAIPKEIVNNAQYFLE